MQMKWTDIEFQQRPRARDLHSPIHQMCFLKRVGLHVRDIKFCPCKFQDIAGSEYLHMVSPPCVQNEGEFYC